MCALGADVLELPMLALTFCQPGSVVEIFELFYRIHRDIDTSIHVLPLLSAQVCVPP
jgi:hypothetical protein